MLNLKKGWFSETSDGEERIYAPGSVSGDGTHRVYYDSHDGTVCAYIPKEPIYYGRSFEEAHAYFLERGAESPWGEDSASVSKVDALNTLLDMQKSISGGFEMISAHKRALESARGEAATAKLRFREDTGNNPSPQDLLSWEKEAKRYQAKVDMLNTRITRLKALVEATTDEFDALLERAVTP
jgi:hypothetical protein